MTFGSLFSGIDGFAEGLERAGMELKWQVEINEYCLKILKQDWPNVPKHKDIRDAGKHNLQAVDLICGGAPCQPFSVAGKRKGTADDRYLWPEMLRVISEIRPRWVFAENVPGILHIDGGLVIEQVLSSLENEGYETLPPFIIPACAVDAPHRRDRVWIVAYSDSQRCKRQPVYLQPGKPQQEGIEIARSGEVMADTTEPGFQDWGRSQMGESGQEQESERCCGSQGRVQHWPVEPGICGIFNEFSKRKNKID